MTLTAHYDHISLKARERAMPDQVESDDLVQLKPKRKAFVMDLLSQAGVDVDEWHCTAEGKPVNRPRANPSHCYDWSFGNEVDGFVLCLWHGALKLRSGQIVHDADAREHAELLQSLMPRSGADGVKRHRLIQQIRRANAFDAALDFSYRKGRPLRVILNVGDQRQQDELAEKASRVSLRSLDDAPWFAHARDPATGRTLLIRNVPADPAGTGPAAARSDTDDSPDADDERRLASILTRRGQARFRSSLLAAYNRQCAVTGSRVVELLEAAHVIPHSEGPDYAPSNGLLLRADIHTLYDLHLLSVDERFRIHLSKSLRSSDYARWHGELLKVLPDKIAEQASSTRLKTRHERFLQAESDRP